MNYNRQVMEMRGKILLTVVALCATAYFSVLLAYSTYNTDFPVFYRAASSVLDSETAGSAVYDFAEINKYPVQELDTGGAFIYSLAAAYFMAPLALLPYYTAKALIIFLGILSYFTSVIIILRLAGFFGSKQLCLLALSLFWFPFIRDLRFAQINSIMLLLVVLGIYLALKRPLLAGMFIGIASLFKLSPLAIAMVLGLKNWRIFAGCFAVFAASFTLPGASVWFTAISNIYPSGKTPMYLYLSQIGLGWFAIYVALIAGLTALVAYKAKDTEYLALASLAVPSMFLCAPVIEQTHLTFLILPFLWLLAVRLYWPVILSVPLMFAGHWFDIAGLLILWVSILVLLTNVWHLENYKHRSMKILSP